MVKSKLALISGSGGVGRTTIAANLAHHYSRTGHKTLLVDLCFGWGGLNNFASNLPTLEEILECDEMTDKIISNSDYGFDLLTSIPPDFLEFDDESIKKLAWVLDRACANYEQVVYDSPSGGHPLSLLAAGLSDKVFIMARPDATSFGSAYCLLKSLHLEGINSRVRIAFSMVESEEHAASLKTMFDLASERFLGFKASYGGYIPRSAALLDSGFHVGEIGRISQTLLEHLDLTRSQLFQSETFSNSDLNTFPGRLNHRR